MCSIGSRLIPLSALELIRMQSAQLTGFSRTELSQFVEELGEPKYRGEQIFGAIQRRRVRSFDEITDLPKEFRATLAERARTRP